MVVCPFFDWYFSGEKEYADPLFKPEPGANLDAVKQMFAESGAYIFGRKHTKLRTGGAAVTR